MIYKNKKEWEKVKELFDLALSIDPKKTIEVRSSYLSVEETVNNYTEHYWANAFNSGVEQFQNIERDPDNKIKYLESAIKSFENATLIKPSDANTYSTLAKCYFDYGDKDAAKNAASTAVERNPDSFDANFAAGQIIQRADGSSDEILAFYKKAVSINPSHSRALRELASLYYDIGNKEESIQVFNNAIENEENKIIQADLYFNLGVIHSQMKNFSGAEDAFEEAIFFSKNKKVLDLGSNQGFFCFQASLHGATETMGVELQSEDHQAALDIEKIIGTKNTKFVHGDAVSFLKETDEKYGLIIMNSVLHQIYKNFNNSEEFMQNIAKKCEYFAFETPLNHPLMSIHPLQVHAQLNKYFKNVRLLNVYDAYSSGYRANYVCFH